MRALQVLIRQLVQLKSLAVGAETPLAPAWETLSHASTREVGAPLLS